MGTFVDGDRIGSELLRLFKMSQNDGGATAADASFSVTSWAKLSMKFSGRMFGTSN